ncbi:MAG: exodeoxyribonuclease VII small subunit [Kiritimatiellae bacterium]|nr:exodeoxyribonuclease VII small subunit [Kiritimatiellia bacterium]
MHASSDGWAVLAAGDGGDLAAVSAFRFEGPGAADPLSRIDEIVAKLNDGETTLEESLALYAEGTKLLGDCTKQLGEARAGV